jgi:hypothetical protein
MKRLMHYHVVVNYDSNYSQKYLGRSRMRDAHFERLCCMSLRRILGPMGKRAVDLAGGAGLEGVELH